MNRKYIFLFALCLVAVLCLWKSGKSGLTLETQPQEEVSLVVEGEMPSWLSGALIRNSAIPVFKNGKQVTHEFDGMAMLHKCTFDQGKLSYQSRYLDSQEYRNVMGGRLDITGFGTESADLGHVFPETHEINNASVNVFTYNDSLVALTETPLPVRFDGKTLETLGAYDFQDDLPKNRCWESAHPHYDIGKKEIVNYLLEFGSRCYYVPYRIKEGSKVREEIAKVPVERPSYMHSFAMTDKYVIFTEFPLRLNPQELMDPAKPYIHKFQWLPETGTRFIVVERATGRLVMEKAVDPIFSFHHANAYEDGDRIIVDLVAYPDLSSMPALFPQAATKSEMTWKNRLLRYEIAVNENSINCETLFEAKELEFPRFDDRLDGKSYRFLYMTHSDGGLVKVDLRTLASKTWKEANFEACEPIFVPKPGSVNEDDGMLLTIIGNKKDKSAYLVIVDAVLFTEIARAKLPNLIPASFHGQFFGESQFISSSLPK